MSTLYARTVFFVRDAARSLEFYTTTIAIHDLDQNELFFWLPDTERGG